MRVRVQMEGVTPLAMRNGRLIDKEDEFTRLIAEITAKRKRTPADDAEVQRLEFLGGLYHDPELGVYVPAINVLRGWKEAAKITKQGTALTRAIALTQDKLPLGYEGPREPLALWEDKRFRWKAPAGIGTKRVMRMRALFREWRLGMEVELLETGLDPEDFVRIVETAGRSIGLGDGRVLGNGRYAADVRLEGAK